MPCLRRRRSERRTSPRKSDGHVRARALVSCPERLTGVAGLVCFPEIPMGNHMKKILLAWRVSATWMRITFLIVLFLIGRAIVGGSSPTPPAAVAAIAPAPPAAIDPIEEIKDVAIHACRDAIIGSATNKSSVSFHSFSFPPQVRKLSDSAVMAVVKFSAKNGYGAESASIGRCVLSSDGSTVISLTSEDSR